MSGFILFSTNGGAKWNQRATGLTPFFYALDFPDAVHGYVAGDGGAVYRSSDAGQTWSAAPTGVAAILRSISFSSPLRGWTCGDGGALVGTIDGGSSWLNQSVSAAFNLNGICALDSAHAWAVGDSGVIWTLDAGPASAGRLPDAPRLRVYPVPARSHVNFHFEGNERFSSPVSLRIWDLLGNERHAQDGIRAPIVTVASNTIGRGMFFYEFRQDTRVRRTGTFIVTGD